MTSLVRLHLWTSFTFSSCICFQNKLTKYPHEIKMDFYYSPGRFQVIGMRLATDLKNWFVQRFRTMPRRSDDRRSRRRQAQLEADQLDGRRAFDSRIPGGEFECIRMHISCQTHAQRLSHSYRSINHRIMHTFIAFHKNSTRWHCARC